MQWPKINHFWCKTLWNGTIQNCFNSLVLHVCLQVQAIMLAALTLASLSLLVKATNLCPTTCQCLHNLTIIECQEKGLSQIPELPESTELLFVSYNEIQEIPRRGLERLQVRNIQQPGNCALCKAFENDAALRDSFFLSCRELDEKIYTTFTCVAWIWSYSQQPVSLA